MARLPVPGSDDNGWGDILNDFLSQSHDSSGSLKPGSVGTNALAANAVTQPKLGATGGSDGQALVVDSTKSSGIAWQTLSGGSTVPDATTSVKGVIQLAGDIAGTASLPTVPALATKANETDLTAHTTNVSNPHAVTKTQVGLSNVDNTSDVSKPVSTAAQTALGTKANDSSVVHVTGAETVAGVKTFSSSPVVPTPTTATQSANKSYVDSVAGAGAADATTSSKGIVQLAGDLAGTAAAPTVPGLATKANTTVTVTGSQSLTGGGDISASRILTLVNDASTPGNSKYYGTDSVGSKGYFGLPTGGGSFATLTDGNITTPTVGQKLSYDGTSSKWKNIPGGIPLATVSLPGTLATGTISLAFPIMGTWLFESFVINVGTASGGAAIVADLQYNGTTIFGTPANRPSVAAGAYWTTSGAPSVTQFFGSSSTRGYLVFSLASIGSTGTEGADLVATLYASRVA